MIVLVNFTGFLSESRDLRNLCRRIGAVASRFGITSKKFGLILDKYDALSRELGSVPTFPITAVVLRRHAALIRGLNERGVEFAVHGYVHVDYATMPAKMQKDEFKGAMVCFEECGVPFSGFRAPFLRTNDGTLSVLNTLGFAYDSSRTLFWDVVSGASRSKPSIGSYNRLLEYYKSQDARDHLALPSLEDGVVEIPVSLPDDESMIDRLGIKDSSEFSRIWSDILEQTHSRGELFTLQLHPERIFLCASAMADTIRLAKTLSPSVWVATLGDIAQWWREKADFSFEIHDAHVAGKYRIRASCSDRATVLFRNCSVSAPSSEWSEGYRSVKEREFVLDCAKRPSIGVRMNSSPASIAFLKSEGYNVELSEQPGNYSVYFDDLQKFDERDMKALTEEIARRRAPLLRFWRWPNEAKSALSVTGDIDSITLADFVLRILERQWRMVLRNPKASRLDHAS